MIQRQLYLFCLHLKYLEVIFLVIKHMELLLSESISLNKIPNTLYRLRRTILIRGIVIFGFTRKDILLSVYSIKLKHFVELLLVMTSLIPLFLLLFTLLLFSFCLNSISSWSFQIRPNISQLKECGLEVPSL